MALKKLVTTYRTHLLFFALGFLVSLGILHGLGINTQYVGVASAESIKANQLVTPNQQDVVDKQDSSEENGMKLPSLSAFEKKCIMSPNNDDYSESVVVCSYFYKPFNFEYWAIGLDEVIDGQDKFNNYFEIHRFVNLTDKDVQNDIQKALVNKGYTIVEQGPEHAQYFEGATYYVKAEKHFNGAPTKTVWVMYYKNSIHNYGWKFTLTDDGHHYTDSIVKTIFYNFQVKPETY